MIAASLRVAAVLAAASVSIGSLGGCSGRCSVGEDGAGQACRVVGAREQLRFGMPKQEALALLGDVETVPPWHNELGIGPDTIRNPYDSQVFTSPIGEQYEVTRYFVAVDGQDECPFIRGRLDFAPLIFFEDELVGWHWSYLEDVMQQRLGDEARLWRFGEFCDGRRATDTGGEGAPAPTED